MRQAPAGPAVGLSAQPFLFARMLAAIGIAEEWGRDDQRFLPRCKVMIDKVMIDKGKKDKPQ